jgi:hypothetical protein
MRVRVLFLTLSSELQIADAPAHSFCVLIWLEDSRIDVTTKLEPAYAHPWVKLGELGVVD